MSYAGKILVNDLKNILRDRLYVYIFLLYPLLIVVLSRLLIPWVDENLFNLDPYYPQLFMAATTLMPMVFGYITAFLIMDERDENLLTVLRVMPISRSKYLIYRMSLMTFFTFVYVLLFPTLTGLVQIPLLLYLPVAVLFAMLTPVVALLINVLASNKVQGFAVMKTLGSVFLLPLIAFFISGGLRYAFGVLPNFWTYMALNTALNEGTHDLLHLGIGFAIHIALIIVLFRIFNKKF